jgi:hypothetical protein
VPLLADKEEVMLLTHDTALEFATFSPNGRKSGIQAREMARRGSSAVNRYKMPASYVKSIDLRSTLW